jgi:hypothetical protein
LKRGTAFALAAAACAAACLGALAVFVAGRPSGFPRSPGGGAGGVGARNGGRSGRDARAGGIPAAAAGGGFIEIDLTEQRLRAFEGDEPVFDFMISSGVGRKTPTGVFHIWKKHRRKDMEVGLKVLGKYFVIPDVPYVMFYFGEGVPRTRGFAVHGAYWHDDFGRPVTHGCINLRVGDARRLFFWTEPSLHGGEVAVAKGGSTGTRIEVRGDAPGPGHASGGSFTDRVD